MPMMYDIIIARERGGQLLKERERCRKILLVFSNIIRNLSSSQRV